MNVMFMNDRRVLTDEKAISKKDTKCRMQQQESLSDDSEMQYFELSCKLHSDMLLKREERAKFKIRRLLTVML